MAIKFNNNSQKAVIFNGVDQKRVIFNNKVIWCKPFRLMYIQYDSGISSVSVTRLSSEEPSAVINEQLAAQDTIYFNDVLRVTAIPKGGYSVLSGTGDIKVTEDTDVDVKSNFTKPVPPSIWDLVTEGPTNAREVSFALFNNNPYNSPLYYEIYTTTGTRIHSAWTGSVNAKDEIEVNNLKLSLTGSYDVQVNALSEVPSDDPTEQIQSNWSSETATYTQPQVANPTVTNVTSPDGRSCSFTIYNPNSYAIIVVFSVKYDAGYNEFYDEYSDSFELAAKTSTTKSYTYISSTTHTDRGFLHVQGKMSGYKNSDEVIYNVDVAEETTTRP